MTTAAAINTGTEMFIELCAETTHEINRVYCRALGDYSQHPWAEAPDWQKDSARAGVRAILEGKIKGPEDSHAVWMALKEAEGWRYGPVKDPEAKVHPCMVPYDQLPADQRFKDKLFFSVISACCAASGAPTSTKARQSVTSPPATGRIFCRWPALGIGTQLQARRSYPTGAGCTCTLASPDPTQTRPFR